MGFTSQDTPHWYWNYGLEATSISVITAALETSFPFSNLVYGDFVPSTVFPTRGYRGATPPVPYIGNAISALYWRLPSTGDALSWRRLFFWAMPHPPSLGPSRGPTVSLTLT